MKDGTTVLTTDAQFDGSVRSPGENFMTIITLEPGDLNKLSDMIANHQLKKQLKGIGA